MHKTNKIVAAVVGFGLALSIFAVGGALTANAQAMTLSQLVDLFISLGIIAPDKAAAAKAAVTSSASTTFTRDLTVGSSGADVTALQNVVGVSPATGYFGSITKAAVQAYQAANGVPSTGYVGPLTRAVLNKTSTGSTGTTGGSIVVNSGVEGSITATKSSVSNSTVREGETMKTLLGVKLEAKLSDINVQRVKVDLGTSTTVYTKVFKTLYLTDDSGKVLAQADLNSNTVVKDGTQYALTFGGFSYNVPKDSTKYLWVKGDLYSSIKTEDQYNRTIRLFGSSDNAIRGVDGAGIDQYTGDNDISQSISIDTTLVDEATLKLSTNSANYKKADVIAASGGDEDEADMVPVLAFDFKAEKDNVLITDIVATVAKTGTGAATATKAYLYDGSNLIDSEDITSGSVTFDDIDLWVNKDSTKTLTLKVDIRDANITESVITASVTAANVTAENSVGSEVDSNTGSATGESMTVRNAGPIVTLVSKTLNAPTTQENNNISTTTRSATFTVRVKAVGSDLWFGTQASTSAKQMFYFATFSGGSVTSITNASSTSFDIPTSGVVTSGVGSNSFKLQENNEVTIPVTVAIENRAANSTLVSGSTQYSIGLQEIRWSADDGANTRTTTFMTNNVDWRTPNFNF
jgi:hypothetical protein